MCIQIGECRLQFAGRTIVSRGCRLHSTVCAFLIGGQRCADCRMGIKVLKYLIEIGAWRLQDMVCNLLVEGLRIESASSRLAICCRLQHLG